MPPRFSANSRARDERIVLGERFVRRSIALAFVALGVGSAISCVVADVDYVGKQCEGSCPGGLRCIDGACVTLESLVYVSRFQVDWATPNSIRWKWKLEGDTANVARYELVLTSPVANAAGVRTWTAVDNAELGGWFIRNANDYLPVEGTITDGLDPSTSYSAQLRVLDVAGHVFTTRVVPGQTDLLRPVQLLAFDETLPQGAFLLPSVADGGPPPYFVDPSGGLDGGASLHYLRERDGERDGGAQNLKLSGLSLDPPSAFTTLNYGTAFLELSLEVSGTPASVWSNVWVRFQPGPACGECIFQYEGRWVMRASADPRYRTVQIPLRLFENKDRAASDPTKAITYEIARSRIQEVNVYFPHQALESSELRLDRVGIHW